MKKKPSKKIVLNRETLRQLDDATRHHEAAGGSTTPNSCCCSDVCTTPCTTVTS